MGKDFVITIKIADVAPLLMHIDRSEEERVRNVEYNINKLWSQWRAKYHERTSEEVLAMVTFAFAKQYLILAEQEPALTRTLNDFEHALDEILLKVD